jgi:pyruvate dehydrogenase E2 component (dihydrolipoamide acetyltransferase)
MATQIVMPSFGMYTAEGTLVNWLYPNGARVKQGETVLEIETEKAVNPVISPADGILYQAAQIGTLIKEQGLLGYIMAEGEPAPAIPGAAPVRTSDPAKAPGREPGVAAQGRVRASPAARKLALENKIALETLTGSGPEGRIVEADVKAAITIKTSDCSMKPGGPAPLSTMRRTIGERLRRSIDTAVSLTITREVEAGELVRAHKVLSELMKCSVPYDALFMKLLASALRDHPASNAILENDTLRLLDQVDICFAVSVPEGLVVPVVRKVDTTPLAQMVDEMSRLAQQARSNSLRSEDLSGGSSTVSNLGASGVDIFTPILNPPQSSILGVGRIAERPVAKAGVVSVASTCWLSFTFDHRVLDGVPAAGVLESIAKRMTDREYFDSLA